VEFVHYVQVPPLHVQLVVHQQLLKLLLVQHHHVPLVQLELVHVLQEQLHLHANQVTLKTEIHVLNVQMEQQLVLV